MNRVFITLSFLMGVVVLTSNYLVQFPINYFGLNEILTYGAFSYPIAFLITDLANRSFGKLAARKIVYVGFTIGILFTLIFLGGSFLHLAANTYNDYFDWTSGTDQLNNDYFLQLSGGSRAIELGLISFPASSTNLFFAFKLKLARTS